MFREEILKVTQPRVHKVTNSIGVYDIYKLIRKDRWNQTQERISESDFYKIIRAVNKEIARNISLGEEVHLPHRMGYFELRKRNVKPVLANGKLKVKYPIDWKATLELWEKNTDLMEDKVLVRRQVNNVFFVYYNKNKANYINKNFFKFSPTRTLKIALKENIQKGIIDAYTVN